EQQVAVGPQNEAVDARNGVQHVMMVVPVDREIDEAEHVAEEMRSRAYQRRPVGAMRQLQLQHHDGDDDGDDAVAESRQTFLAHDGSCPMSRERATGSGRSTVFPRSTLSARPRESGDPGPYPKPLGRHART